MVITANNRYGVYTDTQALGVFSESVSYASVADSKITSSGVGGIRCGRNCRVENSLVSDNGSDGIAILGAGGLMLGNIVSGNNGFGIVSEGLVGAGNNTVVQNLSGQISGGVVHLQPNACDPACPPPP